MQDHQRDIVVLGYSNDVETLFRHLDLEAPAVLHRIVVVDPRPNLFDRMHGSGVEVRLGDPMRIATLGDVGLHGATTVLSVGVPGTDLPGSLPAIVQRVRRAHPRLRILAVATDCAHASELRLAGADEVFQHAAMGELHHVMSRASAVSIIGRVLSWRFAVLVGIAAVDAIVFVIPLTATALLIATLVAPEWLRRAARFLDHLAGPAVAAPSGVQS
jgi:voltage-gated potassium channel Kch